MQTIKLMFQKPTGERRLLEVSGEDPFYKCSMTYCATGKVSEVDWIPYPRAMSYLQQQGQILVSRGFIPQAER